VHTMEHLLQEGITYLPCLKNALFLLCFIRDWEISQQPQPVNNEDPAAALTVQNFGPYAKGKPLSPSKFYKMWRERLSNVKVVEMFSVFFLFLLELELLFIFKPCGQTCRCARTTALPSAAFAVNSMMT
jgi:hypothetical protein